MNNKFFLGLVACLFCFACNEANNSPSETIAASSSIPDEALAFESNTDSNRTVIKKADIKLNVNNLEQEIQSFQDKVNDLNGHVFHYEINNIRSLGNEFQQHVDSTCQLYNVEPIGFMKVKVPVSATDEFVQFVLSKHGVIEHFMLDEEDVTEVLQEKTALVNTYVQNGVKKQNVTSNPDDKYREEEYIRRKIALKKLAYQTTYLWFDISMKGQVYTDKQFVAKSTNSRTSFSIRALKALDNGWYLFSEILIGLLHLWPFGLIALCGFWLFKKIKIHGKAFK